MQTAIKLIVGLGNPTQKYSMTRHNAGFWFLDALASTARVVFREESRFEGEVGKWEPSPGTTVYLLKPQTFMNRSGSSVAALARYFRIQLSEVLVAHDELDFSAGVVKLKRAGGHGGHNGLRDIIAQAGGSDFYRLRFGIGHPGNREAVVSYVLEPPRAQERDLISIAIGNALEIVPDLMAGQVDAATRRLHC